MKKVSEVLLFWYEELTPKQWWTKDPELDAMIRQRFASLHRQAHAGALHAWRDSSQGALAEIIVLDQFSRNMFRNTPEAYAGDPMAVALTQCAIARGLDRELKDQPEKLAFLYMPLMHSESSLIHEQAVPLFSQPGLENNLKFELKHKAIIDKFGRYPHRNQVLGRISTHEELLFLQQPGSSF